MSRIDHRGGVAAVMATLVAACTAATSPLPDPGPTGAARATIPAASRAAGSAASSGPILGALAAELDIGQLDPALTEPLLAYASDGTAVLFSSGVAGDAAPDAAPDLWRFRPDIDAEPQLLWRNPERDHSIVGISGDVGTVAFTEMPITGERAWNLWLIPEPDAAPILLDTHPANEEVSSLVPSLAVSEGSLAWTAFDIGATGPVSQLVIARAPEWRPVVLQERAAREAELWMPSIRAGQVAYTEVRYSADRSTDERYVYLLDLADARASPRRLDASGRATMPLLGSGFVLWKEADPGASMFNWGTMHRHDLASGETRPLTTRPQEYVNYPSLGYRFAAWAGADSFAFAVHDLELGIPRLIQRHPVQSETNVLRPVVAGDLLVWLEAVLTPAGSTGVLRYAWLPGAGTSR